MKISNIAIAILDFSLLLLVKLQLLIFAVFFCIRSLFLFFFALSIVIALPTIARDVTILHLSDNWEVIQKRSNEPIYKQHKNKQRLRATTFAIEMLEERQLYGEQYRNSTFEKIFRLFGAPILFSLTVNLHFQEKVKNCLIL